MAERNAALERGDREAVLREAHLLVGMAGNAGAMRMSNAARRLEQAALAEVSAALTAIFEETMTRAGLAAACGERKRRARRLMALPD